MDFEFEDFLNCLYVPSEITENSHIFELTISQNELLKHLEENDHTVIYKKRRQGVSTAISIYLLWLLLSRPKYKIILVSKGQYDRECFRQLINSNLNIIELIAKKQGFDSWKLTTKNHNVEKTIFANNSEISYLSINNIHYFRGFRVNCLYFSELLNEDNFFNTMTSALPCIFGVNNSKLIISTTDFRNIGVKLKGIKEHWVGDYFDGKRFVIVEKKN